MKTNNIQTTPLWRNFEEPQKWRRIDFDAINAAALNAGHRFLSELVPGGKLRGLDYCPLNPRRNDHRIGSFKINFRTGVWADFATGDKGTDPISWYAYASGLSQGEAAREIAARLRLHGHAHASGTLGEAPAVPACLETTVKSENLNARASPYPPRTPPDETGKPAFFRGGDPGPRVMADELRRHIYARDGVPVRIKIKTTGGGFVQWFRVRDGDGASGWQARKPAAYQDVAYVGSANPFGPEVEDELIFWPEGEKDVDTLDRELGLLAFCFGGVGDGLPEGAGAYVAGRDIIILSDNDDSGRQHANRKAVLVHTKGGHARVVHFPELPEKHDVSDAIAAGMTREQLLARAGQAPPWSPSSSTAEKQPAAEAEKAVPATQSSATLVIRCAAEIQPEKIRWLWWQRIAIGKLTLIAGEPGLGKSQLTAAVAAVVTTGGPWPNEEGAAPLGSAVILSAEDDAADTIVPRLIAAGAKVDSVHIISAVTEKDGTGRRVFNLQADLALLEAAILKIGDVRLVIIDPISSYLGRTDSHKNSELRATLEPAAELASRLGVALLAVTHLNKNNGGSANHRVTGSIAFVAAARACYIISRDPDDEERRLFLPSKNNLGPDREGLAFRIGQRDIGDGIIASSIYWDAAPVTRSADEILSAISGEGGQHTAKADWTTFLGEELTAGPVSVVDLEREATAAGLLREGQRISQCKPARSARDALGIKPYREGGAGPAGKWLWALPSNASPKMPSDGLRCPVSGEGTLRGEGHLSAQDATP